MRMFFGFLLLVSFIGEVFADDICSQDLGSSHPCPAGKYYDSDQDECWNCPAGYYCPGDGMAYCCNTNTNGMFPNSDTGVSNINSCYTKVTCATNNDTKVSCQQYDEYNNCQTLNDQIYTIQIGYDTNYQLNKDKQASVLFVYSTIPDGSNYHIESIPHYSEPPQDHTGLWLPTSYTFACVPNTQDCKDFFPSDDMPKNCYQHTNQSTCEENRCNWSDNYQKCMLFDQIGAYYSSLNCTGANNITGEATWNDETNTWDISQCRCTDTEPRKIGHPRYCYISGGEHDPVTEGNFAIIHSINEYIIFKENITSENNDDLPCIKCFEDTDEIKYYVEQFYPQTNFVAQCAESTKRGSYRIPSQNGYCGGSIKWENLNGNPCPKADCPIGQTTDEILPIGPGHCKYTDQTRFCDAKGCFDLSDINQWRFQ